MRKFSPRIFHLFLLAALCAHTVIAQDSATGGLRGTVADATGGRISGTVVTLTQSATGIAYHAVSDAQGNFVFGLLRPGEYELDIAATGMKPQRRSGMKVDVGGEVGIAITLQVAGAQETVTVEGDSPLVETQPAAVSDVIDQRALEELPLNGRRFTDLALLTPGVTQDPRSLTSGSNGDLAFGGVRGFHSSFLVDGVDNNNGFFSQASGRYRAPYQFSNETIQEFRVSSNTYGSELGRSGGAVINVVTKSGSNHTHGSLFYYLRDNRVGAIHPFVRKKFPDRQNQFGGTIGGPIKRNRAFYFAGFDQHIFHVPTVVQFANGSSQIIPGPGDFEFNDEALVADAANQLSTLGGQFRTALVGNSAFLKVDVAVTPHHYLSAKANLSRFYGENNVFFDPASPITNFAISENGEERVSTESASLALTSAIGARSNSHLRAQFSRDLQESTANSGGVRTRINDVIAGFGRSSILPRRTRQHRVQIAETLSYSGNRHSLKFGGDLLLTRINNFFPLLFGGQYTFDDIRVNPFTFQPQTFGLRITPLRAFAHDLPRFYRQNFGDAVSRPDTNEYSAFLQDTIRIGNHLGVSLGVRYDLQTFRSDGLVSNPIFPDSGRAPSDTNNISPRVGFAASIGSHNPLVLRGGYGIFYTRIPQIYNSAVETENGINRATLSLDNTNFFDRLVFPAYPTPLVNCPPVATTCAAPDALNGFLTTQISSFAHDFQIPYVQQASFTAEKEVARRTAIGASYLFVSGKHLIRARDVNLPQPVALQFPLFDETGGNFTGQFYTVESFSRFRFAPSLSCPFPPCIDPLARPISNVGAINVFESAASSTYHGFTLSAKRRFSEGLYFRLSYTLAKATDDGQDALVAGSPSLVQNSFAAAQERGRSVTDQRHRVALAFSAEPNPFHRDHRNLATIFNDWRFSGVLTTGSGRPVNARVIGDANRDDNTGNDRLPGASRNGFNGPDYISADMRITRRIHLSERLKLEATIESFNVFNRANKRVDLSDDGFSNVAATFVQVDSIIGSSRFPGQFRQNPQFLKPTNAFAPRQAQFSLRLKF